MLPNAKDGMTLNGLNSMSAMVSAEGSARGFAAPVHGNGQKEQNEGEGEPHGYLEFLLFVQWTVKIR